MKVNFGNINFGRAIKIQTNFDNKKGKNPDFALENVFATLYGTLSGNSIYDSETSREIGTFLRAQIGDFDSNGRTMFIRKLGDERYLFTGNEAAKVRSLDGVYLHKTSEQGTKEEKLLEMVEDGTKGKDKSEIIFNFDDENKLKEVCYHSSSSNGTKFKTSQNILTL